MFLLDSKKVNSAKDLMPLALLSDKILDLLSLPNSAPFLQATIESRLLIWGNMLYYDFGFFEIITNSIPETVSVPDPKDSASDRPAWWTEEYRASKRKWVLPCAARGYLVFKPVEYQKALVFPRALKAKNEDKGKSSDSSPSRGATTKWIRHRGTERADYSNALLGNLEIGQNKRNKVKS